MNNFKEKVLPVINNVNRIYISCRDVSICHTNIEFLLLLDHVIENRILFSDEFARKIIMENIRDFIPQIGNMLGNDLFRVVLNMILHKK